MNFWQSLACEQAPYLQGAQSICMEVKSGSQIIATYIWSRAPQNQIRKISPSEDSTGKEYFVSGFVQGSRPSRKPCAICSRRQYPSQPPFCSHFKQFPSPSLLKAILSTSSLIFRSTCFPTLSSSHYSKVYNYYTLTTQCSYALGSVCCVF